MVTKNLPATPPAPDESPPDVKSKLAGILLGYAGNNSAGQNGLSRRDMAAMAETSWEAVDSALKALRVEGAIGIDRHRLVIRKSILLEIYGDGKCRRKEGRRE